MGLPDFDPYDTLGVLPNATPDEIRAAYRRLAAACHPDIQPPEKKAQASERMIQLNAARDLLLSTRRRVQYHREHADHMRWYAEKTRWQAQEAQAAYQRAHPPRADPPSRRGRDQMYTLVLFTLAGLTVLVILALPGLAKSPATYPPMLRETFSIAVEQTMIWMAAFGGFFLAALEVLFLTCILALVFFGLTRWWRR